MNKNLLNELKQCMQELAQLQKDKPGLLKTFTKEEIAFVKSVKDQIGNLTLVNNVGVADTKESIHLHIDITDGEDTPTADEIKKHILAVSDDLTDKLQYIKSLKDLDKVETNIYNDLNAYYDAYSSILDPKDQIYYKAKINNCKKIMDQLRIELSTSVLTNKCETVTLVWTIKKYSKDVISKEDRIKKNILKISEVLAKKYNYDNDDQNNNEDSKGRKKRLIKKLENLKIKETILGEDNSKVIDTEIINLSVTFCKKLRVPTGSEKGPVSYWGISEIGLPADRQTSNDAGISFTSVSAITENGFSDKGLVTFNFKRGKAKQITFNWEKLFGAIADFIPTDTNDINWTELVADLLKTLPEIADEEEVDAQDETFEWEIVISTALEDLSKITINVSPSTDHKVFDELSFKKVERIGTNVTFEGDLEKANIKFISDAMKKLVN